MNDTIDASDALAQHVIRRAWRAFVARRNARLGATLLRVLPPALRDAGAAEQREGRVERLQWMEAVVASYVNERESHRRLRRQHMQCLRNRRVVVEVPEDATDAAGSLSLKSPQKSVQLAVDPSSLSAPSPTSFPPSFIHLGDDASIRDHVMLIRSNDARHKDRNGGLISPEILSPGQSLAASQTRLPDNGHEFMMLRSSSTGTSVDAPSPSLYYAGGDGSDTANHSTVCSGQSTAIDGLLLGIDDDAFRSVSFLISGEGGPLHGGVGSGIGGPGTTSRRGSIPRTSPGDWWSLKVVAPSHKDPPNVDVALRMEWTASAAAYAHARRQLLQSSSGEQSGGVSPQNQLPQLRHARGNIDRTSSTSSASDIVTLLATCPTLGSYEHRGGSSQKSPAQEEEGGPVADNQDLPELVIVSVSQTVDALERATTPCEAELAAVCATTVTPPDVTDATAEQQDALPFSFMSTTARPPTTPEERGIEGDRQPDEVAVATTKDARGAPTTSMQGYAKRHVQIKAFSPYSALMEAAPRRGSVTAQNASPHRDLRRTPSPPASAQRSRSPILGGAVMSLRERIDQQRRMLRADPSLTDIVDRQVAMRGTLRQHRQPRNQLEQSPADEGGVQQVRPGSAQPNSAILANPSTSPLRLVTRSFTPAAERMKSDTPGPRVPPLLRARCHAQPTGLLASYNGTPNAYVVEGTHREQPHLATLHHQDRKLRIAHLTPSAAWKRKQDAPLSKERTAIVPSHVVVDRIRLASQQPDSAHFAHAALPYAVRCMASAVQPVNFRPIPSKSAGGLSMEDLDFLKKFHASVYYT